MKTILFITMFVCMAMIASAQKTNIRVGISFDFLAPMGDFNKFAKPGIGGSARGLFAVGRSGDVTLTTGFYYFGWKDLDPGETAWSHMIPILIGYRHTFASAKSLPGIFIEPFVGYGIYGEHYTVNTVHESSSFGSFAWGGTIGFSYDKFEAGLRYLGFTRQGTLSTLGVYVGYDFPLHQ